MSGSGNKASHVELSWQIEPLNINLIEGKTYFNLDRLLVLIFLFWYILVNT